MLKRGLLIISIIFILSSLVYAVDEFKGYKYSGDEFKIGTDDFSIRLSNDKNTLLFKNNIESIGVNKGDCKSTIYYKYCFYYTIIDFDKELGKLHDYTGEEMPAINISVLSLKPDLTIIRSASSITPYEYDEVEISVTFTNKGKKQANIIYEEEIKNPSKITYCKDCLIIGNKLRYETIIHPSDEVILEYKINPGDAHSLTLLPNITFISETQNGSIKINSLTITPKKTIQLSYSGEKNLVIEQNYDSKIIFKNNEPTQKISFVSELIFDDELIFDSSDTEKEENKLVFKGLLDSFEEKEFDISFLARKSGNKDIIIITNYTLSNQKLQTNTTLSFEKNIEKPLFDFQIDDNMFLDKQNNVKLIIDNSNSKNSFKNMNVKIIIGDVINEEFLVPFIKFSRELIAYDKDFTIINDTEKNVEAKLIVEYETLFGEKIIKEIKKNIRLEPIKNIVSLEYNVEDYKQKEGDVILSLFLTNNDEKQLILNVSEIIDGAEVLTTDARKISDYSKLLRNLQLYIDPLSKKQVFSYLLRKQEINNPIIKTKIYMNGVKGVYLIEVNSLFDFEKKTYEILNITSTKISNKKSLENKSEGILKENIELEQTHEYEVEKELIQKEVKKEVQEQTKTTEQITENIMSKEEIKEKNFFQKMWDVIKSFF